MTFLRAILAVLSENYALKSALRGARHQMVELRIALAVAEARAEFAERLLKESSTKLGGVVDSMKGKDSDDGVCAECGVVLFDESDDLCSSCWRDANSCALCHAEFVNGVCPNGCTAQQAFDGDELPF